MTTEEQKIPVIEIFGPTIQGEGLVIGNQTWFIRLGGCDYKCRMCDSLHAIDAEQIRANATYMDQDELCMAFKKMFGEGVTKMVTLSGGNPALWELGKVVDFFHKELKMAVAIETQGTYYKDWISRCDIVTISPKGPGMGEKFRIEEFRRYMEELKDHRGLNLKVVVFGAADIEFALSVKELAERITDRELPFYLSLGNETPPGYANNELPLSTMRHNMLSNLAIMVDEVLKDPRCKDFIILPQLHVLLWGNMQGV